MADIIQFRRDTAAAWTAANPILAQGEPAMEIDTLKEKRGDGVTPWVSLPYREIASFNKEVEQTAHGFIVGNAIRHNGIIWVKAQADSLANSGSIGVVGVVTDANNFTYSFGGFLVPGTWANNVSYFLSPAVAGGIIVEPTYTIGQVREFIGTGTPNGLLIEIDLGDEIVAEVIGDLTLDALALKAPLASPTFTGTVSGINKNMVGLPNVDDTADLAKPTSIATQSKLDVLTNAQTGGLKSFTTLALLQAYATPNINDSYKVTNDGTTSNNGYYHWVSGATYEKDFDLVNGAIVSGNVDAVKGGDIFDYNNLYKSQSLKKTLIGLEQNFYSDYSNAEAKSTFIAPITLSSDGDYVEFEVILKSLGIGSSTSESMGIMGQATTSNSHLGFNYSGNFLLKAANDIFVSTNAFSTPITANGLPMKVKVAYEGGVINTYKNDVLARANMVASNIILDNIGQSYGVPSFSGILRQVTISHSGGTIVSIATPYLDSTYLTNTKSLEILNTSDGYLTEEQLDYANKTDLKTDLKNRLDTISSFNSIYNGVDSKSDFNTPITLSTDGDYLEFEVLLKELGTSSNTSASMGIVGELGLGTSNIGFINSGNLYIRNSVGVWISTNGFNSPVIIDGSPLKVKMSYEDGSIKTYLNDTYQKTLTASTFIIKNIGSSYNIFPNALFKGGIRNIKISHSSGTIVSISTPYFDETYLVNSKVILNPSTYGYLTPSQVESLKNVTKYPKAFYEFDKIGNAGEHKFKAYISYKEQNGYYIGFDIVRNKDLSDSVYTDNYRISTTTLYFYNGVGMVSQGIELLTSLDNESVYGIVGGSSSTGGVHGNEIFTEAHFFVDGVEITDLTTNIPLTECADFYYTQISNTFTVDDITHSIETIHHKINKFKDNGFSTFNRFIWQKTVNVFWWYHALVCISKGLATQGHNEFLDTATMIGDSLRKLEKIGAREFYSNNQTNGLSAFVTSKMIKPIGDESVVFFVNDRVIDSKYYRKLETPPNPILNDVWESLTEVEFYKK